jgi:cephalosporin hydroxylase
MIRRIINKTRAWLQGSEPACEPELPHPTSGPLAEAGALMAKGQAYAALKKIESFLSANPQHEESLLLHATCLEQTGRHEEALVSYQSVVSRNPDCPLAKRRLELLIPCLIKPTRPAIPTLERPYKTEIPLDTLMGIELATHAYTYKGVLLIKNPFDFALYHTLLWNLKPRTIIEIGSKSGGSALWMGDLLNSYGIDGHVYSLDIVKVTDVQHPRVTFMEADGRNLQNYLTPEFLAKIPRPLLVIEDADHTYETSIATLRFFHPWLKKDEFIVVEDGIISDMLMLKDYSSGPHRALKEFIREYHTDYEMAAEYCDFFGYNFTWCTNGYLRKLKETQRPEGN